MSIAGGIAAKYLVYKARFLPLSAGMTIPAHCLALVDISFDVRMHISEPSN